MRRELETPVPWNAPHASHWSWTKLLTFGLKRSKSTSNSSTTTSNSRPQRRSYTPRYAQRDAMMSVAVAQQGDLTQLIRENTAESRRRQSVLDEEERVYRSMLHRAGLVDLGEGYGGLGGSGGWMTPAVHRGGGVTATYQKVNLARQQSLSGSSQTSARRHSRSQSVRLPGPLSSSEDEEFDFETARQAYLHNQSSVGSSSSSGSTHSTPNLLPSAVHAPYLHQAESMPEFPGRRSISYQPDSQSAYAPYPAHLAPWAYKRPMGSTYASLTARQRRPQYFTHESVAHMRAGKGKGKGGEAPLSSSRQPSSNPPSTEVSAQRRRGLSMISSLSLGKGREDSVAVGQGTQVVEDVQKAATASNDSRSSSDRQPPSLGTDDSVDLSWFSMETQETPPTSRFAGFDKVDFARSRERDVVESPEEEQVEPDGEKTDEAEEGVGHGGFGAGGTVRLPDRCGAGPGGWPLPVEE